jgi:ABC-type transporter Mla subunit MlaD
MIEVSKRLTERMSRARLEVEIRRSLKPLAVLAAGALVGLAAWLFVIGNVGSGELRSRHTVRFEIASVSSVQPGRNPVMLRGVEIGTISAVALQHGRAVITAELQSRYGPIYRDARAQLRPATALENMYLDIVDRGTPAAGEATAARPLAADRSQSDVQVEQVLQAFAPNVRAHLATTLDELGRGLDGGRGDDLRRAFVQVVPFLQVVAGMSHQLGDRADLTRRLVSETADITQELGRRETSLRTLVTQGGRTLGTLGTSAPDLDATLRGLPPTLTALRSSFAAVDGVVGDVDQALDDLGPAAQRLPGALRSVRRLSAQADPALQALRRPVRRLVPLASALRPVSGDLAAALRALQPQLGAVDHVTRSAAGCSYAINKFFEWTASVTKFDDGRSEFPRGSVVMSTNSFGAAVRDPNTQPAGGCAPGIAQGAAP